LQEIFRTKRSMPFSTFSALVETEGLDLQQRDAEGHRFGTLAYPAFLAAQLKAMNRRGRIVGNSSRKPHPGSRIYTCYPTMRSFGRRAKSPAA
jgi:hypothetical protein